MKKIIIVSFLTLICSACTSESFRKYQECKLDRPEIECREAKDKSYEELTEVSSKIYTPSNSIHRRWEESVMRSLCDLYVMDSHDRAICEEVSKKHRRQAILDKIYTRQTPCKPYEGDKTTEENKILTQQAFEEYKQKKNELDLLEDRLFSDKASKDSQFKDQFLRAYGNWKSYDLEGEGQFTYRNDECFGNEYDRYKKWTRKIQSRINTLKELYE